MLRLVGLTRADGPGARVWVPQGALETMDFAPLEPVLVQRLHRLLESSDLDVTTEKHIRVQLEKEFGIDLSERKKALRQEIQNFLNTRQHVEEPAPKPEKKKRKQKEKAKKPRKKGNQQLAEG